MTITDHAVAIREALNRVAAIDKRLSPYLIASAAMKGEGAALARMIVNDLVEVRLALESIPEDLDALLAELEAAREALTQVESLCARTPICTALVAGGEG